MRCDASTMSRSRVPGGGHHLVTVGGQLFGGGLTDRSGSSGNQHAQADECREGRRPRDGVRSMTDHDEGVTMSAEANRKLVTDFWSALYQRDWDRVEGFFAAESQYTDMPTPPDEVAVGPEQILCSTAAGPRTHQ